MAHFDLIIIRCSEEELLLVRTEGGAVDAGVMLVRGHRAAVVPAIRASDSTLITQTRTMCTWRFRRYNFNVE